jgi:acyl CoA:acetate/3-ketoacid CoA transferase beta subunit
VTPKCIFDFDPDTLEARLAMLFPGVTVDDVKANTGFEVKAAKKVESVPPPTKEELEALRTLVDKTGVLRHS